MTARDRVDAAAELIAQELTAAGSDDVARRAAVALEEAGLLADRRNRWWTDRYGAVWHEATDGTMRAVDLAGVTSTRLLTSRQQARASRSWVSRAHGPLAEVDAPVTGPSAEDIAEIAWTVLHQVKAERTAPWYSRLGEEAWDDVPPASSAQTPHAAGEVSVRVNPGARFEWLMTPDPDSAVCRAWSPQPLLTGDVRCTLAAGHPREHMNVEPGLTWMWADEQGGVS